MDTNSKDDVIAQTSNNQENDILLNSLSFNGLEVNPVISSSLHLILLSKKISESNDCTEKEIEEFKKDFINEILSISAKLSTLSIYDEQDITRFRYCLCVFIDEMVMKNQSFMSSTYSLNSLSIRFFKEPSGGNKFFGIMDKWLENPAKNKDMLEFIYVCLILGYQGKFSVDDDGEKKLHLLMENIASAVAPTLNIDEMKAFELAYTDNSKENFLSKYGYILKKLIFIIIPVFIIIFFYIFNYFIVYKNNIETSSYVSNKINISEDSE